MTAAQWLVLDNLKHHWPYWTNMDRDIADKAYIDCVRNEWIKDGKLTPEGEMSLLTKKIEH